jgi:hypothetical protein
VYCTCTVQHKYRGRADITSVTRMWF